MSSRDYEIEEVCRRLIIEFTDPHEIVRLVNEMKGLLSAKGDDYSGEINAFANFRTAAVLANVNVLTGMRYLIAIKTGRLLNLLSHSRSRPTFESEFDNWKDLLGYIILMLAYLKSQE